MLKFKFPIVLKSTFLKHLKPFLLHSGFDFDKAIASYRATAMIKSDEATALAKNAEWIANDGLKAFNEAVKIANANLDAANKSAAAEQKKADLAAAEAKATMESADYLAG